jgi:hypothetical protein
VVVVVLVVGVFVVAELTLVAAGTFASFLQLVIVAKEITPRKTGRIIFFITKNLASKFTKYFQNFHQLSTLNFMRFIGC